MGSVSTIAELRSDPERLLNSGTGKLELALLGSLRSIAVPAGAKSSVWHALGVQVMGTSLTAAANSSSWVSALWRGTHKVFATTKGAVAVPVVIATLGAGALHFGTSAPDARARAASAPSPPENTEASGVERASPEAAGPAYAEPSSHATVFIPPRDHLREESALLERARALLRSGQARAAQTTLVRLQARFPKGSLTQNPPELSRSLRCFSCRARGFCRRLF